MISRMGSAVRRHARVTSPPTTTPTAIPPSPRITKAMPASASEKIPVTAAAIANR
jgi:hypothetical protein